MMRAKYGLLGAMLTIASLMTSAGCVEDYVSLQLLHNQAPDDNCMVAPNPGDPYLPHGTADLGAGGYVLTPLLQSNLTNRTNSTNGDIIQLHTATVEIEPVDSDVSRNVVSSLAELRGRTRYISGMVSPGGLTSTEFEAIDVDQARALAGVVQVGQSVEVLVRVIVHGDVSGTDVESQPFLYPITLLNGGLEAGKQNLGPCSNLPTSFIGETSDCFQNGQDGGFTQCCTDAGGVLICPAVGTAAP